MKDDVESNRNGSHNEKMKMVNFSGSKDNELFL